MTANRLPYKELLSFLVHYLGLGVVVPVSLLQSLNLDYAPLPFGPTVVVQGSALMLSLVASNVRRSTRIVDLAFWLYVYLFLGLAGGLQRAARTLPWPGPVPTPDVWAVTDAIVIVGLIAYATTYLVVDRGMRDWRPWRRLLSARRTVRLAVVAGTVILALFFAVFGPEGVLTSRSTRRTLFAGVSSSSAGVEALTALLQSPLTAALPALILLRQRTARRGSRTMGFAIAFVLGANLVVNNFANSPRYAAGTVLLAALLAVAVSSRRALRWLAYAPAVLIAGMLLVFPVSDIFRGQSLDFKYESVVAHLVNNGDFDSYQMIAYSVDYTRSSGVEMGRNILGVIGFWIPRAVWSTKPRPTGEYLAGSAGLNYDNLSAPLWAEGFVAWGWFGVVVLLGAWGVVAASLDESVRTTQGDRASAAQHGALLACIVAPYSLFLIRGSLMPTVAYLVPTLLFTLLFLSPSNAQRVG